MDNKQDVYINKCCWKQIKIGEVEWLVKAYFANDFYEVMFSDQANIWQERLSISDIKNRAKEINSNLEIEFQKLLEHISHGLDGRDSEVTYHVKTGSPSAQKLTFGIKFKLAGLPFEWLFFATRLSTDIVRDQLTRPLMTMVVELNRQKKELMDLLKSKDREIADLRAQGAKSKKRLETAVFDETLFISNMLQSKEFANNVHQTCLTIFDNDGQQLYSNIMEKVDSQNATSLDVIDMMLADSTEKTASASCSTTSSPTKSPEKLSTERTKETELQRRLALEQKLAEEERKEFSKKKKKLKL